jgi:glycosyltransferase involved in cell wall biosynthesis
VRILIAEQSPRFAGGSERLALSVARYALSRGHEVWLAYECAGDMVESYVRAGARAVRLPLRPIAARQPADAWRALRTLRAAVVREAIEVVFSAQVPLVPLMAAATWATRARTAVHLGLVYDFPSPIFQRGLREIDLGIAPSVHTSEGWRQRGWPAERLRVIENGIDDVTFTPGDGRAAARARLAMDSATHVIAYVGRLVAAKGIFTLLDAFISYRRQGGEAMLWFAGDAPEQQAAELETRARAAGLWDSAVRVRPATSVPEDIYRAADIVVLPAEWDEPFGLAPLEAAACGTLALVSDRGRLPEFVSSVGAGAVVRAGDVDDLSTCLTFWLSDDARRETAAARLRTDVVRRFAFDRCGGAYLSAFHELARAARAEPLIAKSS